MRTSLIRRAAASLLALSLVSAAPLAVQAQEDETQKPISFTQEHVTLEHTEYEYTGNPIEPNVTVRVEGTLLTLDQHYSLSFADNTEVGQAKATVTGIETAGYTGKVEIPFTIVPKATEPSGTFSAFGTFRAPQASGHHRGQREAGKNRVCLRRQGRGAQGHRHRGGQGFDRRNGLQAGLRK